MLAALTRSSAAQPAFVAADLCLGSPPLLPVRTAKLSEESNVTAEVAFTSLLASAAFCDSSVRLRQSCRVASDCIRLHARTYQEQLYVALAEIPKLKLLR